MCAAAATAAPTVVPGFLLRFNDKRAEDAWRDGFFHGVRSMDRRFALWNLAADLVRLKPHRAPMVAALLRAYAVSLAQSVVVLYVLLWQYPPLARRRGWWVALTRLVRLGERTVPQPEGACCRLWNQPLSTAIPAAITVSVVSAIEESVAPIAWRHGRLPGWSVLAVWTLSFKVRQIRIVT